MRKMLAILIISIHLLGNTEVAQLIRIPGLIEHFLHHHRINPKISFFEFMAMHYGGDDGTTADDDFDKKLPCHNAGTNTIAVIYTPLVNELPSIDFSIWKISNYNNLFKTGKSSKHVQLVLQPPRHNC